MNDNNKFDDLDELEKAVEGKIAAFSMLELFSVGALVYVAFQPKSFIDDMGMVGGILVYILICAVALGFSIACAFAIHKHIKDSKLLKAKRTILLDGTLVSFEENKDPDTGVQENTIVIVSPLNGGENIRLYITYDYLKAGEKYRFRYLPNTKTASVVCKLDDDGFPLRKN